MHKKLLLFALFSSMTVAGSLPATANSARDEKIEELLKQVENAEPFQPITTEQVAAAREELKAAMSRLENQLERIGSAQADRWKTYLKWEDLKAQVESEKPSRQDLLKLSYRYRKNHPGLELRVFRDVRTSIVDFANKSFFSSEAVAKNIYEKRLALIKSALTKLKAGYDDRTIGLLGEAVSDLENSGNCPELIAAIRTAFAKPNIHFELSESLAKSVLKDRKAVDTQPVREVIVGVVQEGTAHTTATFDVDFLKSRQSGKFKLCINGITLTDQVGTKELGMLGNVYICSEGNTCLVGEAIIEFDGQQVSYSDMAAGAQTKSNVKGINSPPLLRNATWKQIEKKKSQGEAEAAAKARAKFVKRMRSQLNETIGEANQKLKTGVNSTAKRLDFEPKRLEVTTSDDSFRMLAIIGNRQQLTSLQGPDANVTGDIVAQVHESSVNNGLQHLLGGRAIGMDEMRQLITSFGVELPAPPEDEKPLTITFPRVRPVQVTFDGQQVTTVISANQIQSGNTVVKDKLKITVKYTIESMADLVSVAREGDVTIDFEGAYTNSKSVIESNIKPKLEKLFKSEKKVFRIAELKLPEAFEDVRLPSIERLDLAGGWLVAQLNMPSEKVAKQVPVKKLSQVPVLPRNGRSFVSTRGESTSHISDRSVRIAD